MLIIDDSIENLIKSLFQGILNIHYNLYYKQYNSLPNIHQSYSLTIYAICEISINKLEKNTLATIIDDKHVGSTLCMNTNGI